MLCPGCEKEMSGFPLVCPHCRISLHLLRQRPGRVAACIWLSVLLGAGLFLALAYATFAPLAQGEPLPAKGPLFWWGFGFATFFLALGLGAKHYLAEALTHGRALPRGPGQQEAEMS